MSLYNICNCEKPCRNKDIVRFLYMAKTSYLQKTADQNVLGQNVRHKTSVGQYVRPKTSVGQYVRQPSNTYSYFEINEVMLNY